MRLKCRDKQQQRYQHRISTSMSQTVSYSQALASHHYPVSHTQMQAPHQQMQQTFTHVTQGLLRQQLQYSQQHFQQTFTQLHAPAQQQFHGQAPQQSMQPQQHLQVMSEPQQLMQQAIQPHHFIQSQQPVQQQQQQQAILTHQPLQQQQPTQQHSQQTSQQQTSQSTTFSSQLRVMSPPVTTPDIKRQGTTPLTRTPTGFTLSPPMNPPPVDSQYFTNIPNMSQDVRFSAMNMPQFQAVEDTSTTQPDQPAAGDQ